MKKVAIISVIKRWDKNVTTCLNTVIRQTYTNWVYVIIASEESKLHIENYLVKELGEDTFNNKIIIQLIDNLITWGSRSDTLRTNGDYIFNLDGDDNLEPDCLEKLIKAIEQTNSDIACCGVAMHDVKSGSVGTVRTVEKTMEFKRSEYCNNFPFYFQFYRTMWGKLYKSSLFTDDTFKDIPIGEERGGYAGDTMCALAILSQTKKFVILEDVGYHYMIWEGNVSKKFLPNREKADPLLYQHLEKFLLSCDKTISSENSELLSIIHNNGIRDVLQVLSTCELSLNEKFDKFYYIITNDISVKTIPLAREDILSIIQFAFFKLLDAINQSKNTTFELNEVIEKQIYEMFLIIWSDKQFKSDNYKKTLISILKIYSIESISLINNLLKDVSPNCYKVITIETFEIFQNDNTLLKTLVTDDVNIVISQLFKGLKKDNIKEISLNSIKLLLPNDSLYQLIDEPEFILRYKKIAELLIINKLEEVFDLMTDTIMSNKKLEFIDTYLNIYIQLSNDLGIELGVLVGKLKLAQFLYDNNNFDESITISKELLQLGFQSDELDELVSKLLKDSNEGNNVTKSKNAEIIKKSIPEMNIVRGGGGLANQMYQYFFLRSMEEKTNQLFVMDNLELLSRENPSHNGFELDKVFPDIKLKYVTDYLEQDVIDEIIQTKRRLGDNQNIPNLLNEHGFNIKTLVWEQVSTNREKQVQYNNFTGDEVNCCDKDGSNYKLISGSGGYYYCGVFPGQFFFDSVKEKVLQELQFPPITDKKNQDYYNHIKSSLSVGIHVRRGDFVNLGWDLPASKYVPAINQVKQQTRKNSTKPTFFIISDDINWCKENIKDFGLQSRDDVVFVEGNFGNQMNYIDLQFLATCKIVISNHNSSFSRVALWLNQNLIGQIRV